MKIIKEVKGLWKDTPDRSFGLGDDGYLYMKLRDGYQWIKFSSYIGFNMQLEDMKILVDTFAKFFILK
jgi:hypothetical protein